MAEYINRARVLKYINDIQLTVSDPKKPTILPRGLCEWIFDGISTMPTIEVSTEGVAENATTTDCIKKQVAGKLNNADDSLLTEELETCKEQKSKLDCISRQQAIEALIGWQTEPLDEDIVRTLENLPTITPTERTGEWKHEGDCGITRCSQCGWSIEEYIEWDYCPNCGAKMKG